MDGGFMKLVTDMNGAINTEVMGAIVPNKRLESRNFPATAYKYTCAWDKSLVGVRNAASSDQGRSR